MTKTEIIQGNESAWVGAYLKEHWSADFAVSRGKRYDADMLTGIRAVIGGKLVGAVTWHVAGPDMQIVTLDSFDQGSGIGTGTARPCRRQGPRHGTEARLAGDDQ